MQLILLGSIVFFLIVVGYYGILVWFYKKTTYYSATHRNYLSLISDKGAYGEYITYMKLKPLADRVLLKQEKAESKTASGIIIPETAQEKTQTAKVEAVGPGTEKDPITVKVGDRVMYDKYAGVQVKMDGEDYLIVKNSDIIAIVE